MFRRLTPWLTIVLGFSAGMLLASLDHILPPSRVHGPLLWVVVFVVVALCWGVVGMGPEWMLHNPLRALIGSVLVGGTFGVVFGLGARWSRRTPS